MGGLGWAERAHDRGIQLEGKAKREAVSGTDREVKGVEATVNEGRIKGGGSWVLGFYDLFIYLFWLLLLFGFNLIIEIISCGMISN